MACMRFILSCLQVKHMRASYGSQVLFTLMNSFSTSADTRAFLEAKHPDLLKVGRRGDQGCGVDVVPDVP